MRHRVAGRKLKRTASHRRALLRSLSMELIRHKRITTTLAKAKEASRFAETLITRAKRAYVAEQGGAPLNLHARRIIERDIKDRSIVSELFNEIAPKVADRPGGYTRVVRLKQRLGDGAEMAILELVDYNLDRDDSAARSRSKKVMSRAERVRRSQEKQKQKEQKPAAEDSAPEEEVAAAAVAEEVASEVVDTVEEEVNAVEETVAEGAEEAVAGGEEVVDAVEEVAAEAEETQETEEAEGADEAEEAGDADDDKKEE